jgi:hypothetical protein
MPASLQRDIRQAVPNMLFEQYDIVHIRLLSFVLQDEEIASVLRNVQPAQSVFPCIR